MAYCVLPFEFLNIQIKVLIIQRTACLHLQRSMLSKPGSPISKYEVQSEKYKVDADSKNTFISVDKMQKKPDRSFFHRFTAWQKR
jgi:hypothetical protein